MRAMVFSGGVATKSVKASMMETMDSLPSLVANVQLMALECGDEHPAILHVFRCEKISKSPWVKSSGLENHRIFISLGVPHFGRKRHVLPGCQPGMNWAFDSATRDISYGSV